MTPDNDRVVALLRQVADQEILPRFRRLLADDVIGKPTAGDPEDIVTAVDRQVEARLISELGALTPGIPVVGEESAHERPELLRLVEGDDAVWIVDPIDGTKNFAHGDDGFGVMLAFLSRGVTRAAWILLPARGQLYTAESGAGAFRDGARLQVPSAPAGARPRGPLKTKFMPPALALAVEDATRGRFNPAPLTGCSATEYPDVITGAIDFAVYYRLNVWDHAAAALILTEAGGVAEHLGGGRYTPRSTHRVTVVARNAAVAGQVLGWMASK